MNNFKFGALLFLVVLCFHFSTAATIATMQGKLTKTTEQNQSNEDGIPTDKFVRTNFDPKSCPFGTYPSQDMCWMLGPNCLTYNSAGACLSCPLNMKTENSRCVPAADEVKTCLEGTPDNCTKCAPNTINPRPGYCEQIEPNCKYVDKTGACRVCKGRFFYERNLCLTHMPLMFPFADENCLVWKAGKCIECKSGWVASEDIEPCYKDLASV